MAVIKLNQNTLAHFSSNRYSRFVAKFLILSFSICAVADTQVSHHVLHYIEADDRVKVTDQVLSFKSNIGVDYDVKMDVGYDAISGASPTLRSITPVLTSDDAQNRWGKIQAADNKSKHLVLAYDPNSEYEVEKVALEDERYSININVVQRDSLRNEITYGLSYSEEEDYRSSSASFSKLWWADKRKNRSYTAGLSTIYNESHVFNTAYQDQYIKNNLAYDFELGLTQIWSPTAYLTLTGFVSYDKGYLSNHYQTILRQIDINNDGIGQTDEIFLAGETRPETRSGGGVTLLNVKQWSSGLTTQASYRFFDDDWAITSHTMNLILDWPVNNRLTFIPAYRYYQQTQAFFYKDPDSSDRIFDAYQVGSSDSRLSQFSAHRIEVGLQYKTQFDIAIDASYAYYIQSTDFRADWFMLGINKTF